MTEIIEKSWGVTRCVHRSAACEVWHASIRTGGQSSRHYHNTKHNAFYVLSGELVIWHASDALPNCFTVMRTLQAGDSYEIIANVTHQFTAQTAVELIETYWLADISSDDIVREEQEAHV